MIQFLKFSFITFFLIGCSSGLLKIDKQEELFKNTEFEKKVQIKEVDPVKVVESETKEIEKPSAVIAEVKKSNAKPKKIKKIEAPKKRQPELEDSEGFNNQRRPLVDPFQVGEKVTLAVSYFAARAGKLSLSVKPYVEVNGKKSYNFLTEIKSSTIFSTFYSVQDQVETYLDYENLSPYVFKLQIKESGQIKEAQSFFDQQKLKANYWEHKYTEKDGHEEKKLEWDLLPFSQNAFSSIFYMRIFKWNIGQEYAFRVSDDGKNIVFKATALEKVKLNTDAGTFDAVKVKAEIVSRGALTQTGDLLIWLSDDEHKYILRIEAKIKIGSLVAEVVEIEPGNKD